MDYGGAGYDTIHGSNYNDTIYGGADDDTITDHYGNNVIYGDDGNDTIEGSYSGNDTIHGGDGDDTINASTSPSGNDTICGDAGNDYIHTGNGADTLYGGDGNDEIHSGSGADINHGGNGDDYIYINADGKSCRRARRSGKQAPPSPYNRAFSERSGSYLVLSGSSPITIPSPSSKARQKSGSFAPPALPGLNAPMTLSDSRRGRRLKRR